MRRSATIKKHTYDDLGFAKVDIHRKKIKGVPEIIYAPGKTPEQILKIMLSLSKSSKPVIVTRVKKNLYKIIRKKMPSAKFFEKANIIALEKKGKQSKKGNVLVITAGTSDQCVGEEALCVLKILGNRAEILNDVGVAGIHRLFRNINKLRKAKVIIVIAGMEGALASVVSGLVSCPLIAVPTSVGYGASFKGIAPLLTMLNCCSPGVVVVNIDNGFGAAYFAHLINK